MTIQFNETTRQIRKCSDKCQDIVHSLFMTLLCVSVCSKPVLGQQQQQFSVGGVRINHLFNDVTCLRLAVFEEAHILEDFQVALHSLQLFTSHNFAVRTNAYVLR